MQQVVRKSCRDRAVRKLVLEALETGARARKSKGGLMLYGPNGAVAVHYTNSDGRAVKNLRSAMVKAGIL